MLATTNEFVYKLPGSSSGNRPGAHRSKSRGAGMEFAAHARLFDQPDPRRLDLRASLQDIRGDWLVRTHLQRSAVAIKVIVDVSQSMRFGSPDKLQRACEFIEALGNSANSYGDSVSLLAFDQQFREDLYLPARTGRANGINMASLINECSTTAGQSSAVDGLSQTVDSMAGLSGLVFIISDFHWELDQLDPILDKLSAAMVVPLVVWDQTEVKPPPVGQWIPLRDMSSGSKNHIWLKQKTREQWLENIQLRREALLGAFEKYNNAPLFLEDIFNPEQLSQYFMENIA